MATDPLAMLQRLDAARLGWMTGQVDRAELDGLDAAEANLALLAMDGQFRALAAAPKYRSDLRLAPPFPPPEQSYPPVSARDLFLRVFEGRQPAEKLQVLRLLDRRGYQAHPFDFMPEVQWDGLPESYVPLLAWVRAAKVAADAVPENPYSATHAHDGYRTMRERDRGRAEEWLRAELAGAGAPQRHRMLRDISPLFDVRDIDLLKELAASDRSSKVVTLANQLLRRLGLDPGDAPDTGPLDYIEQRKAGLLRRQLVVHAPVKMNPTRRKLLVDCLDQLALQQVATHFALDEAGLIAAWDWKDGDIDTSRALVLCAMTTGSDAACLSVWQNPAIGSRLLTVLDPEHLLRLPASERAEGVNATLSRMSADQQGALLETLAYLRHLGLDGLDASQSTLLWKMAVRHPDLSLSDENKTGQDNRFRNAVFALAMVLQPQEARAALERLLSAGLHGADPALSPLHLNVSLPPVTHSKDIA